MEEAINSAVEKIVEFAKNKKEKIVSWDEITPVLGQDFVNSPDMEAVLKILSDKKIQLIETDIIGVDDQEEDDEEIMLDQDDDDDLMKDDTVSEIEKAEKQVNSKKQGIHCWMKLLNVLLI